MKRLPLILACALLTACGTTPPVRYYTLGPLTPAGPSVGSGPGLVVGPVGVPASIDRLLIVRHIDGARADVSDGHRWAAPLKTEIARRVAVELSRRSGNGRIVAWPQSSIVEPEMNVPIDVLRFDAEGFGKVTLEAVWTLRKGGKDVIGRRFVATEQVSEPTWEALAATHGRLVDALAADIATALPVSRTP